MGTAGISHTAKSIRSPKCSWLLCPDPWLRGGWHRTLADVCLPFGSLEKGKSEPGWKGLWVEQLCWKSTVSGFWRWESKPYSFAQRDQLAVCPPRGLGESGYMFALFLVGAACSSTPLLQNPQGQGLCPFASVFRSPTWGLAHQRCLPILLKSKGMKESKSGQVSTDCRKYMDSIIAVAFALGIAILYQCLQGS